MISEFKTIPKAIYYVQTVDGCTVLDPDGDTLAEITAPGGYFPGIAAADGGPGTVTFSAPVKRVVGPFDLAPQLQLTILGQLGGNDGLPAGYKRLEYLEGTGTQGAVVMTPIDKLSMSGRFSLTEFVKLCKVFGVWYEADSIYQMIWRTESNLEMQVGSGIAKNLPQTGGLLAKVDYFERKAFLNGSVIFDGFTMPATIDTIKFGILCDGGLKQKPDQYNPGITHFASARFYRLKLWDENELTYDLVPALDPTGAPCVFDLVSRKAYYNVGSGDFLYPTGRTTFALRRVLPDWGKLTENGLRRLYHAPAGYQGELYDYALENGFKPIIETEQPEDGYWSPRWTETEEEIVLEWVETDPPMEDYLTQPTE